jgi:hypothetical protein
MAPFAFLGSAYDQRLRALYTDMSFHSVLSGSPIMGLFGEGLYNPRPLQRIVARQVDQTMLVDGGDRRQWPGRARSSCFERSWLLRQVYPGYLIRSLSTQRPTDAISKKCMSTGGEVNCRVAPIRENYLVTIARGARCTEIPVNYWL